MEHVSLQSNNAVEYEVQTMNRRDVPQVMEILKENGWPIGVNSLYTWFEIDPNGWKVAVNQAGEVLGLCCAVQLTDDFHFLGYYAVKERFRGKGIGPKIWNACVNYIGPRNACLSANPNMTVKYQRKGDFSFIDNDLLSIYETHDKILVGNLSPEVPEGISIVSFDDSYLAAILEYDRQIGGGSQRRQQAIELTCKERDSKTLVALRNGICVGFGTLKICSLNVPHLAPMYADNVNIAEFILKRLLEYFPDHKGFSMGTFAANKPANELMEKIACPKSCELYHIYIRKRDTSMFKASMNKMFAQFDVGFSEF